MVPVKNHNEPYFQIMQDGFTGDAIKDVDFFLLLIRKKGDMTRSDKKNFTARMFWDF
jgi:hypothetical protein